jgi:uncharacterized protein (DUF433 family)
MAQYPLTLPTQLQKEAEQLATQQGISLNQFIQWAVSEKVGALKQALALADPAFPEIRYRRGASERWQAVVGNTAVRVQTIALAHSSWQMSLPEIAAEYGLSEAQVTQAWQFYQTYQNEIELNIAYEASLERQYNEPTQTTS